MLCLVDLQMFADVAVERVASIFRIQQSEKSAACPLKWKHCSLPKGRWLMPVDIALHLIRQESSKTVDMVWGSYSGVGKI